MRRLIARVAVAAGLAAAAYVALPAGPAAAAACRTAEGVTVVVDFHELGGGVQTGCLPDGGGDRASDLFPAAGFTLDYVRRQPSFVCRVAGKPADDPCVNTPPADAYWGLWWSDGRSGRWTYATTGVGGLTVPDGGYVAFSWNASTRSAPPGAAPTVHSAPAPTQQPSAQPSAQPTKPPERTAQPGPSSSGAPAATTGGEGPSDSASATAQRSPKADPRKSRASSAATSRPGSAAASASETADEVVPASADPPEADGALPAWVAPVAVVLLFGAAGGVAVARRRGGAA